MTLSAALQKGIRVSVAQVNPTTFIVSGSREELQTIIEKLPKPALSPFSALADALRGQAHERVMIRARSSYSGRAILPSISDEEAMQEADVQRSRRTR